MQEPTEALATTAPPPADLHLVALDPGQMARAQGDLLAWCQAKIRETQGHLREVRDNLRVARECKWRTSTLEAVVRRTAGLVAYYQRISRALEAGYIIVPNFPMDVFAIRTARSHPVGLDVQSQYRQHRQQAQALPEGAGTYVSPLPVVSSYTKDERDPKTGQVKSVPWYYASAWRDVAFPVAAAKPVVLEAAARAQALHIFDEIGLARGEVEAPGRDPILLGRILRPWSGWARRRTTFFIAWWLDTRSL